MESVVCQRLTFSQIILTEVLQNMVECVPFSTENNNCFPFLSQKDDVLKCTKLTFIKNISNITKTWVFFKWMFNAYWYIYGMLSYFEYNTCTCTIFQKIIFVFIMFIIHLTHGEPLCFNFSVWFKLLNM